MPVATQQTGNDMIITLIFFAFSRVFGAMEGAPPARVETTALKIMDTENSAASGGSFSVKKAFPGPLDEQLLDQGSATSSSHPKDSDKKDHDELAKLASSYFKEGDLLKDPSEKKRYFLNAALLWETLKGTRNNKRLAGQAFFKAADLSEDKAEKKFYFLKAAHLFEAIGDKDRAQWAHHRAKEEK